MQSNAPGGDAGSAAIDAAIDAGSNKPIDACIDSDHDGVCDSVEWPCSPTLPLPVQNQITMTLHQNATTFIIDSARVNSATRLVATHGDAAQISLHYDITDTSCPGDCVDQIEIGWVAGTRSGCVFDQSVTKGASVAGNLTSDTVVTFPATPGAYDLRLNIGQNFGCGSGGPGVDANGWWNTDPPDSHTIARVCVQ
jgi:hypothetical protein